MRRLLLLLSLITMSSFAGTSRYVDAPELQTKDRAVINNNFQNIDLEISKITSNIKNIKRYGVYLNVKDFGAKGNGTTDDLSAIRSAISKKSIDGGGVVYFPAGNYSVSGIIYLPSSVILLGDGKDSSIISARYGYPVDTVLIQTSQTDGTLYPTASPGKNAGVLDLKFDCSNMPTASGNGTGQCIFIANMTNFFAYRCHVLSSQGYGFHLAADDGTYGLINTRIIDCIIEDCGRKGGQDSIGGGNTDGSIFAFNWIKSPNGTAIDNVHVKNALWIGNRSTGASGHNGQIWSDFGMIDSQIVNNYIENGSIHVYGYLTASLRGTPTNILIEGNHIKNGGSGAILVSPANQVSTDTGKCLGIRIINNTIDTALDNGIAIRDCPTAVISGNTINYWDSSASGAAAISVAGGPNTSIGTTQCSIYGNTGNPTPSGTTLWYKEETSGQSNDNQLIGNKFVSGTVTLDTTSNVSRFYSDVPVDVMSPKIANIGGGPQSYNAAFYAPSSVMADKAGVLLVFDPSGGAGGIIAARTESAGQPLSFWTYSGSSWGERVRIIKTGEVGIGETAPGFKLVVGANSDSTNQNIRINGKTSTGSSAGTLTNAPSAGNPVGYLSVNINGTERKIPYW